MRTRVKICGITSVEDAQAAVHYGADAIGLVFYPPSPRDISPELAKTIVQSLPAFVTAVGLFVNQDADEVTRIAALAGISLLQFHGQECPDYCAQFSLPYIKAVRMKANVDIAAEHKAYAKARALLLDAYMPGVAGGTGETFEWDRIPADLSDQIILAGGLRPDNVARAIAQVHPYAVDVSGGVEASKGKKDSHKIEQFIRSVRVTDQ